MCVRGGESVPVKEWPAAASVVWATRELRECFSGSLNSYIPDLNAQVGALTHSSFLPGTIHLHCFACVTSPQSVRNNVPETLVLMKASGVTGNTYQCPPCAAHLPAYQTECTLFLDPSCSHATHVVTLTRPCYGAANGDESEVH